MNLRRILVFPPSFSMAAFSMLGRFGDRLIGWAGHDGIDAANAAGTRTYADRGPTGLEPIAMMSFAAARRCRT
jgi:hypothetical protein